MDRSDPQRFDGPLPPHQYVVTLRDLRRIGLPLAERPVVSAAVERGTSLLETFGGALPYPDVVLVAVYPIEALQPGAEFAIARDERDDTGRPIRRDLRAGRVTPEDFAAWK
jgi:hypothetical protein